MSAITHFENTGVSVTDSADKKRGSFSDTPDTLKKFGLLTFK